MGGARKKKPCKTAKPISYDNYSTDTSSQFSADIVDVVDSSAKYDNNRVAASAVVAQVSSSGCEYK